MWSSRNTRLSKRRIIRFAIDFDSSPVSFANVLARWQDDGEFRHFFTRLLLDSPFAAFRWETPPITIASADRPFEFVLLDSPYLAGSPDPSTFADYFTTASPGEIVEFPNLGKDAIMIAPCPQGSESDYGHLAAFLRNASEAQQHSLWVSVAAAMQRRLSSRPVWLSTAGGGVAWLHVRLDDRPKYYGYAPYRVVPSSSDSL